MGTEITQIHNRIKKYEHQLKLALFLRARAYPFSLCCIKNTRKIGHGGQFLDFELIEIARLQAILSLNADIYPPACKITMK